MIEIKNYKEMENYIIGQYPQEAVGFVINNEFKPTKNIAQDPFNNAQYGEIAYLTSSLNGIQAIVHSHTQGSLKDHLDLEVDPRTPSERDMQSQMDTDVPWLVFHTDGTKVSAPLEFGGEPAPLMGRPYIYNVFDCWTLVRDYYQMNHKIELPVWPRPIQWMKDNPSLLTDNWQKIGFIEISKSNIQPGDGILFKLSRTENFDHCGIYLGEEKFIHHFLNRYSETSHLSQYRSFQNALVVRHTSLIK
jgi:cell wall-associated NlpC family hydrolase